MGSEMCIRDSVRDDGARKTPRSKSWYKPVAVTRGYDRRDSGARLRHHLAQGSMELGKLPRRQITPGTAELFSLGKGISEEVETNYDIEEKKLFEVNKQVKDLIEELELRNEVKTQ